MNLELLLLAAEYLDRKDREADHGYASTLPCPVQALRPDRRKMKLRSLQLHNCRSTHNELEKNRRAHMKQCLELLKTVVPLAGDLSRHTTLGLLTNATALIKVLRDTERRQRAAREDLVRQQHRLRWTLAQLAHGAHYAPLGGSGGAPTGGGQYRVRPSVSESSSASVESGTSSNSSELDDIDVTGSDIENSDDGMGDISGIASQQLVIS